MNFRSLLAMEALPRQFAWAGICAYFSGRGDVLPERAS